MSPPFASPADLPLAFQPVHYLAPRIARGELSPVDLVTAFLERIERLNGQLHAYVALYGEEALAAAEGARRSIMAGHALGPLHGIPLALKDLCEMEGRVTTAGARYFANRRSTVTATVVERLLAAGMIILGKTYMVEFALGGWGTNYEMGTPWNPWDPALHRVPGGSSSGSGVAVGGGLAALALGSDTGGSVRIPAAFCGLVGLKPTHGRVSNHGIFPLSALLDSVGPMGRSVLDVAWAFAAMNGPDPADRYTRHIPRVDPLPGLRKGVRGLRLGYLTEEALNAEWPMDSEVAAAYRAARERLEKLGARLEPCDPELSLKAVQGNASVLISTEAYGLHRAYLENEDLPFDPWVKKRIMPGKAVSGADYLAALQARQEVVERMDGFMAEYDAVLSPTVPILPSALAEVDESTMPISTYTRLANYAGLCALAMPAGLSAGGLPTSLQLMGRAYSEAQLLRIGWAFEQDQPHYLHTPPLG